MFVFSPMVKLTRARVPLLAFPTPESVISKATWCSQTCPHTDKGRSQTEIGAADFQFPYMEVDHFGTHRSVLMVTHLVCPLPNFPPPKELESDEKLEGLNPETVPARRPETRLPRNASRSGWCAGIPRRCAKGPSVKLVPVFVAFVS